MKLGLYGGLANNMYLLSRALAAQDADVCFIRDRGDSFPFSQPVWEDVECTMSFDGLSRAGVWSWTQWHQFEIEHGWHTPGWLADPINPADEVCGSRRGFARHHFLPGWLPRRQTYRDAVISLMQKCDLLIVCGIEPMLLAYESKVPYVLWPHGEDLLTAAGLLQPQLTLRNRLVYASLQRKTRRACLEALWIGTHDPLLLGGHIGDVLSHLPLSDVRHFPLPMKVRQRAPKPARQQRLKRYLRELRISVPDARFFIFIPSRVDFFWKGQDLLLRTLDRLPDKAGLHFIFSGWGQDYEAAKQRCQDTGHQQLVTFLPVTFSKPLLYEMFAAVDVVVDQFRLGTYGTSAIEAMGCGAPVMMRINEPAFRQRGWETPPVINVHTEETIALWLRDLVEGRIDLELLSAEQLHWVDRVHGAQTVANRFLAESDTAFRAGLRAA